MTVEQQFFGFWTLKERNPSFEYNKTVNNDFKTKEGEEKQNFQLLLCSQVSF